MSKLRIWIAGPRAWENPDPIEAAVKTLISNYGIGRLLVMTGGATGVDRLAEEVCINEGIHVFACRACWPVGRAAGPIRNRIIAEEFAPKALIAFHYYDLDTNNHRGTSSAIKEAKKCGIKVITKQVSPEVAIPSSVSEQAPMGKRARAGRGLPPKDKKRRKTPTV